MKQDELLEAATDFGDWLEENWRKVLVWVGVLVAIGIVILAWYYIDKARQEKASELLGQGFQAFAGAESAEAGAGGSYDEAIALFQKAADKGGGSATGMTAVFYQGISLVKSGDTAAGVELLEQVSAEADDAVLTGAARLAAAHAYVTLGEREKAVDRLSALADDPDSLYPPDMALVLAGRLMAEGGDHEGAVSVWRDVADRYPESAGAVEARELLDRQ
jgi:TolA-binding protein